MPSLAADAINDRKSVSEPPKILFLVTEGFSFCDRRLPLARMLRDLGAQIWVMTDPDNVVEQLEQERFQVVPWRVSRSSLNPFREFRSFLDVVRAYRSIRPHVAHQIALKPIVYGGLAARLCRRITTLNMFVGLGRAFTADTVFLRLIRRAVLALLRAAAGQGNSANVFQNADNRDELAAAGVVPGGDCVIIRGSGVSALDFVPQPEPAGPPVVMLIGRMLWTKGVAEFVQAAKILQGRNLSARMVLVGKPDPGNAESIPESELRSWNASGLIEWWGQKSDMPATLAATHIVCLPSYGEGVPKSLVEAALCARPIVATDVPGCREVVRHGINGLLVPARSSVALADALAVLIADPGLRQRMGAAGRKFAASEFSDDVVLQQFLAVYRRLLPASLPAGCGSQETVPAR